MLKSKRLAYDGRGNAVAKSEGELSSAIDGKGDAIRKEIFVAFHHFLNSYFLRHRISLNIFQILKCWLWVWFQIYNLYKC